MPLGKQKYNADLARIGSFYAFILSRSDRVRLTVVARSNYDAVNKDVSIFSSQIRP